jgi:hypothetical protein
MKSYAPTCNLDYCDVVVRAGCSYESITEVIDMQDFFE